MTNHPETPDEFIARNLAKVQAGKEVANLNSQANGEVQVKVEARTFLKKGGNSNELFIYERLRGSWVADAGEVIAYRTAYYTLNNNGKWIRPQANAIFGPREAEMLSVKALAEGTIL
ncbi:MAG: hypothetical protein ACR2H5_08985 [Ktedonobacteraceae bacterium]